MSIRNNIWHMVSYKDNANRSSKEKPIHWNIDLCLFASFFVFKSTLAWLVEKQWSCLIFDTINNVIVATIITKDFRLNSTVTSLVSLTCQMYIWIFILEHSLIVNYFFIPMMNSEYVEYMENCWSCVDHSSSRSLFNLSNRVYVRFWPIVVLDRLSLIRTLLLWISNRILFMCL
jgi:hypothetical protein